MMASLRGGEEGHSQDETLNEWIIHHLQDTDVLWGMHLPQFNDVMILGIPINFSLTSNIVMMWIASVLLIGLFWMLFRNPKRVPTGMANAMESVVLFIRDEIAVPNMGTAFGTQMTPFLCTLFFFILTCNLLGLIPTFSTASGNIAFTAGMALVTFALTQYHGIKHNGFGAYLKHLVPSGVPAFLWPIMIPIEILGLFTKPFALCMRLFANMVAGHTVIFALLGLIIVLGSVFVAFAAIPLAIAINFLELFVAFLQAYIFVMLSALFIGMSAQPDH